MNNILFSVVIPTYNRAHLIAKAIQSVLLQDYQHFEIIIIDDGSTDNTEEVIKQFQNPQLFYFRIENSERGAARNFGTKKAKGEYVTFLDSDDLFFPNHLAVAKNNITIHHHPEIFCTNYIVIDSTGKIVRNKKEIKGNLNKKILLGNIFGTMGVFIRKDIAVLYPFIEDRILSCTEDWELWLRLASRFHFYYSNEVTSVYVNHENRSVLNVDKKKLLERTELLVHYLSNDNVFKEKYGSHLYKIKAHMSSYSALHLAMSNKKFEALICLCKSIVINPAELFTKRAIVTMKYILYPLSI